MSNVYTSIDQLIGHTPLLELTHFEADEDLKARVLVKLEYFNPAGSVKDRVAKNMIDEAEKAGKLARGGERPQIPSDDAELYLGRSCFFHSCITKRKKIRASFPAQKRK